MTNSDKSHDTALRILEILKILLNEDLEKGEIIEKLKVNNKIENVYTFEAFIKYFNTLQLAGLETDCDKYKYKLKNALIKLDLTAKEQKILSELVDNIELLNNKKSENAVKSLFLRLDKYTDIEIAEILKEKALSENLTDNRNTKRNIISALKNYINDNQKVIIRYRKSDTVLKTISTEVRGLYERNGTIYVVCYDAKTARNQKINLNKIVELKHHPEKASESVYLNSVVFELYGRLSKTYKLKPSEVCFEFTNNSMTISNSEEDKDMLLLRLLKYGENCKILRPQYLQEEFVELTNKILANLES